MNRSKINKKIPKIDNKINQNRFKSGFGPPKDRARAPKTQTCAKNTPGIKFGGHPGDPLEAQNRKKNEKIGFQKLVFFWYACLEGKIERASRSGRPPGAPRVPFWVDFGSILEQMGLACFSYYFVYFLLYIFTTFTQNNQKTTSIPKTSIFENPTFYTVKTYIFKVRTSTKSAQDRSKMR